MTNRQGQRLGNYRLISLLGEGGFAEVYLGEHVFLGTQAAIKVLLMRLADEERERFLNEARTIAGLTHPNILRVLEFGIEDNIPFLVLDFAPNGTLRKRHPKGSILPLTVIVPYVSQIVSALQYIHNRKLIHRDIKPENLLLGTNYEVLLSDFGTAMVFQTLHNQATLEMAGTVSYMAPEQIRGKPRPASDQYGLGVVVYEWLCGVCPFQGTFTELYSQHMMAPPPPLRARNPMINPEVEQVVLTALSKEPEHRFASVSAFANALEQASKADQRAYAPPSTVVSPLSSRSSNKVPSEEEGLPTLQAPLSELLNSPVSTTPRNSTQEDAAIPDTMSFAPQPVVTPQPVITPQLVIPTPNDESESGISRRAVIVGILGLGSVAVAGGAAWLVLSKQNRFAFGVGTTPTAAPTAVGGTRYITYHGHSKQVYTVAWAPNGQYISSGGNDHIVKIWSPIQPAGSDHLTYLQHSGSVNSLVWSPDGVRIASASSDTTVQVWDAATGNRHFTFRGHTDNIRAVAWSPDGTLIASGGDDKTVQVWDANTGKPLAVYSVHTGIVWAVSWSPGGQYIASGGDIPESTVQIWNASTGALLLTYSEHTAGVYAIAWSHDGQYIASSSWGEVRVWNPVPPAGKTITIYTGNASGVHAVEWSPKERRIASGSDDTTVQVWQAI